MGPTFSTLPRTVEPGILGRARQREHVFEDWGGLEEDWAPDAKVDMVGTPDDEVRARLVEGSGGDAGLRR